MAITNKKLDTKKCPPADYFRPAGNAKNEKNRKKVGFGRRNFLRVTLNTRSIACGLIIREILIMLHNPTISGRMENQVPIMAV